ncbi:Response regulator receiver domain-containing protein [Microbispora rosea]|uniref:Response regulator receiver domain-containing protein n=1 Tax=Microbispora rosea TaxID=58117 RepID=A0A1N6Z6J4_9ACTN|nr:Response regulator receiver domain-containing protein [Microbispora rosea]
MAATCNDSEMLRCHSERVALRCLIVDDSDHFKEAARLLLEADGIAVVGTAATFAEALRRFHELRPDLVLVDVDLGEESGFDLVMRLWEEAEGRRPRIILISTYDEQDYAELIATSPAVAFLSKPHLSGRAIDDILRKANA